MRTAETLELGAPALAAPAHRDVFAFAATVGFIIQMWTIPGEWIPALMPLRLGLLTSAAALGLFLLRRIGRMEPVYLDGVRGGAILTFSAIAMASIAWSVDPAVSQDWVVDLVKLVAMYFVIVNVITSPKRLVVACAVMVLASIVTSIGVIHWYSVGEDLSEGFRARWYGVYYDPNHMAEDIGIVIPLAVAFIVRKETRFLLKGLCAVALVLALIAIIESHSRGGFIGLVTSMAVWTFLEKKHRTKALVMGAVMAVGLVLFAPKSFWEREDTLSDFHQDMSAMGRVWAWNVASKMSMDKPLLGVGAGGFKYAWPQYAPHDADKAYVAHNIFLDAMGELGWIGLLCFLMFSGGASAAAFGAAGDPDTGWLSRALAAAIAGYLLCNCFSGYGLSAHLYTLFGLAACGERISRNRTDVEPIPTRIRIHEPTPAPGSQPLLGR